MLLFYLLVTVLVGLGTGYLLTLILDTIIGPVAYGEDPSKEDPEDWLRATKAEEDDA